MSCSVFQTQLSSALTQVQIPSFPHPHYPLYLLSLHHSFHFSRFIVIFIIPKGPCVAQPAVNTIIINIQHTSINTLTIHTRNTDVHGIQKVRSSRQFC